MTAPTSQGILDIGIAQGEDPGLGFPEAFSRLFGDAGQEKQEGAGCVHVAWLDTRLGPMLAAATSKGICLLEFSDRRTLEAQAQGLGSRFGLPLTAAPLPSLSALKAQLADYFSGTGRGFDLPLDEEGTAFQKQVWAALRDIPYGETRSYRELAAAIGKPAAVRAVGHANSLNRIAIIVPCHRVINADGGLGGYAGGLWRKEALLALEGRNRHGASAQHGMP